MADRASIAAFRFGFGLPDGPHPLQAPSGPDHAAALWPGVTGPEVLAAVQTLRDAEIARRDAGDAAGKPQDRAVNQAARGLRLLNLRGARASFARALGGDRFRERLVRFWANHFTVVSRGRAQVAWPPSLIEDAIRPHVGGRFADMLIAVATHPAMLIYLDQALSIGPTSRRGNRTGAGLNENYARELLELHTLGVGGDYSQSDVRQLAELLTGLTFNAKDGAGFDPRRAEPGPETLLGQSYGGKGLAPIHRALSDLAGHPQTARHIAGKLAVHFVSDQPDADLIAVLTASWIETGGDLARVCQALIDHPAAWKPTATKARQPQDFMVAALNALGVGADALYAMSDADIQKLILAPMARMGQPWQRAPGPNGWPEEVSAWITPAGLAARIDWGISAPKALLTTLPDPRDFAETALGPRADPRLIWAVSASESQREGLGLVLASPAFNRR